MIKKNPRPLDKGVLQTILDIKENDRQVKMYGKYACSHRINEAIKRKGSK